MSTATATEAAPAKAAKTSKTPPAAKATKSPADKAAQMAAARAARDTASKNDRYVFVKDNPEAKLPPQAKSIIEIVKSHGKDGVSRENLAKEMETGLGKDHAHKVVTRQPQGRILTYYSKLITSESGICRLDTAAPAAPLPTKAE